VLTSKRSYKEPYPVSMAFEIIKSEREKHFDPEVVDVFEKNLEEIMRVNSALGRDSASAAILDVLGS
jgi:putative two-component system response regulator